jgi:dTDP-4-dehydrorhamnose reductase
MKVFIGSGKVATVLRKDGDLCIPHSEIEVKDKTSILESLRKIPKDAVIVNTASKINLEWCEENKQEATEVNFKGAVNVAEICAELGHHLIHISSGCIFDGMESEKEYTEDDEPTPAAWYTITKTEADKALLKLGYQKITIVRPRQLVSAVKNPTNMLTKFLTLRGGHFIQSRNSMTCIEDMGVMIDNLISKNKYGVYNIANTGHISPFEIASLLKEMQDPEMKVESIAYTDYIKLLKVKRVNTLLNIEKYIRDTGHTPRSAIDAATWCIKNYGNSRS